MSVFLSGFSGQEGPVHAPGFDERFLGRGMDADEVFAMGEQERLGCPFCITSHPEMPCDHRVRRSEDERLGEGEIPAEFNDFRYFDELPLSNQ